jgi:two-component sensor histidine kinase
VLPAESMTSSNPETQRPAADWGLVLTRDGTVLAATGGAPRSCVGSRLVDCGEAPADVKTAGRRLLEQTSAPPAALSVPLGSKQSLHLIVVEAVPVRRVRTDLRRLLPSALEVLERQARSLDVALTIEVENAPDPVPLDADKIAWAVTALVGNALRYVRHGSQTMPGGTIGVRVSYPAGAAEFTIEVQDDGPGISPEHLRQLSGDAGTGTHGGLGLAMVRDIVAAHGGSVAILSDTDALRSGTTVRLRLPAASGRSAVSSDST